MQGFSGLMRHQTSQACLVDFTPPSFAGIASAVPATDGTILASYLAATDMAQPVTYDVYAAIGNVPASGLFQPSNVASSSVSLSQRLITLAGGVTYFVKDQVYTLGVRARDAVGNQDSNTARSVVTATGSGNIPEVFQLLANQFSSLNTVYDGLNTVHDSLNDAASANNAAMVVQLTEMDLQNADFEQNNLDASANNQTMVIQLSDMQANNLAASGINQDLEAVQILLAQDEVNLSAEIVTLGALNLSLDISASSFEASSVSIGQSSQSLEESVTSFSAIELDLRASRDSLEVSASSIEATSISLANTAAELAQIDPVFVLGELSGVVEKEIDP